jgi:glycosyltransferase involved in cell wall biosynthesis
VKIAICICTRQRPGSLRRTLDELDRLVLRSPQPEIRLLVVDNDASGSARPVVEAAAGRVRWPIDYLVEPRPGIPFARNRCLLATEYADRVAFIDDDEIPCPEWLDRLNEALEDSGAQVAAGPVVPLFREPVPGWVQRGDFFRHMEWADGSLINVAFTGNVLFRREILNAVSPWFDERMALTGGSDTNFFWRVAAAGYRIVWSANAIVYEEVPASRMTVGWILRRQFRVGSVMTSNRRQMSGMGKALPVTLLAGARALLVGGSQSAFGLFAGKHRLVKGLGWLAYGAGLMTGLRGVSYQEYRSVHGG